MTEYTAAAKSLQSCPTLRDPIDGSPPGSPVPGILQARTLEWVAISFSNAWKWKMKVKSFSRFRLLATPWSAAYQAPPSMGFSRQECLKFYICLFLNFLPWWLRQQRIHLQCGRCRFDSWLERSPGGAYGNPLQYSCLENPLGQSSLAGYSPWGRKESDTIEWLHFLRWFYWEHQLFKN